MRQILFGITFAVISGNAQAGDVADASEQKCIELTHIVANSMSLTADDRRYCSAYGQYVEKQGVTSTEGMGPVKDGMKPLVIATVEAYLRNKPQAASECTAQKTMEAMAYLFSGGK